MWIIFALTTPLLWSVVHVLDSHCVDEVFEKPWLGVITSSATSCVVLLLLPFVTIDFSQTSLLPLQFVLLALFAGFLIQCSQFLYFQALSYSESGIVAAHWNMVPAILPLASYMILGDIFSIYAYFGIIILVLSATFFCLIDTNLQSRWNTFFLMLGASILQVVALLLEDSIFDHIRYVDGFFLITCGIIVTGLSPLFLRKVRKVFFSNLNRLKKALYLLMAIELFNLCALATSQKAISLGDPSLVTAVESSVPVYTFLLSIVLLPLFPRLGDREALNKIFLKILLVVLMVVGVWMVQK